MESEGWGYGVSSVSEVVSAGVDESASVEVDVSVSVEDSVVSVEESSKLSIYETASSKVSVESSPSVLKKISLISIYLGGIGVDPLVSTLSLSLKASYLSLKNLSRSSSVPFGYGT